MRKRIEFQELVDRQVEDLESANYREVILLRDYQECEWEEICSLLNRPTVSATKGLSRDLKTPRDLKRPPKGSQETPNGSTVDSKCRP